MPQHSLISCPASLSPAFPVLFADGRPKSTPLPTSPRPLPVDEASMGGPRQSAAFNLLPAAEDSPKPAVEGPSLHAQSHILPAPTTDPRADTKQTFPAKKKPPALKHSNTARKQLKAKPTLPGLSRAVSTRSSVLSMSSQELPMPTETADGQRQSPPELLGWGPTSRPVLQISPSTPPPSTAQPFPDGPGDMGMGPTAAPSGTINQMDSAESEMNGSASEESQETTTSTIITTTVITTEPTPGKGTRGCGATREWDVGWGYGSGEMQICLLELPKSLVIAARGARGGFHHPRDLWRGGSLP